MKPVWNHMSAHCASDEIKKICLLVWVSKTEPILFSVSKISENRVVLIACGLNMLHFALIGFIVQFVSVVQCLDAVNTNQSSSADKLLFVHAVIEQTLIKLLNNFTTSFFLKQLCRHAARNIIEPYPNDLYKDESFWDGGYGQITNVSLSVHENFHFIF